MHGRCFIQLKDWKQLMAILFGKDEASFPSSLQFLFKSDLGFELNQRSIETLSSKMKEKDDSHDPRFETIIKPLKQWIDTIQPFPIDYLVSLDRSSLLDLLAGNIGEKLENDFIAAVKHFDYSIIKILLHSKATLSRKVIDVFLDEFLPFVSALSVYPSKEKLEALADQIAVAELLNEYEADIDLSTITEIKKILESADSRAGAAGAGAEGPTTSAETATGSLAEAAHAIISPPPVSEVEERTIVPTESRSAESVNASMTDSNIGMTEAIMVEEPIACGAGAPSSDASVRHESGAALQQSNGIESAKTNTVRRSRASLYAISILDIKREQSSLGGIIQGLAQPKLYNKIIEKSGSREAAFAKILTSTKNLLNKGARPTEADLWELFKSAYASPENCVEKFCYVMALGGFYSMLEPSSVIEPLKTLLLMQFTSTIAKESVDSLMEFTKPYAIEMEASPYGPTRTGLRAVLYAQMLLHLDDKELENATFRP